MNDDTEDLMNNDTEDDDTGRDLVTEGHLRAIGLWNYITGAAPLDLEPGLAGRTVLPFEQRPQRLPSGSGGAARTKSRQPASARESELAISGTRRVCREGSGV